MTTLIQKLLNRNKLFTVKLGKPYRNEVAVQKFSFESGAKVQEMVNEISEINIIK